MFDMGFLELMLVAIVSLLVLGPERLPVAARTVARWITKWRHFANNIKDELEREANLTEMRDQLKAQSEQLQTQIESFEREKQEVLASVESQIDIASGQKKLDSEDLDGSNSKTAGDER